MVEGTLESWAERTERCTTPETGGIEPVPVEPVELRFKVGKTDKTEPPEIDVEASGPVEVETTEAFYVQPLEAVNVKAVGLETVKAVDVEPLHV